MPLSCAARPNMGLDFGLQDSQVCQKHANRWIFQIQDVCGTTTGSIPALPPLKSSRPKISLREQQVQHLVQSVYYPVKVEWETINLTLYDLKVNENPVFDWLTRIYQPTGGSTEFSPVITSQGNFKQDALLCVYDGCGEVIEKWKYENAYPKSINWGDLDMSSSEVIKVDLVLRYDRAYLET